jgi:predicted metal-dependent HD superfamily phosphohydrolase
MRTSPERLDRLQQSWATLLAHYTDDAAGSYRVFDRLAAAYDADDRHYHDLEHVADVLRVAGRLADRADEPRLIQLAVWFHDAVYDSRAKDNEERSAALAVELLGPMGVPSDSLGRVAELIRATAHVGTAEVDADTAVLLDADLAILGAAPERYDRYARAIRREYAWVPEADYRAGRGRVLQGFLDRARIFRTERLFQEGEGPARENLRREIEALGMGGGERRP